MLETVPCAHCGRDFRRNRRDIKHCSTGCRMAFKATAAAARREAERPPEPLTKPKDKRGGARPGSGRKKGQTARWLTERLRLQYLNDDSVTPLEVLLIGMRKLWESNNHDDQLLAIKVATDAAPYMHPRLQAIAVAAQADAGDKLMQLMGLIDGKTTGIQSGEPPLAIEQSLFGPEQGRPESPLQDELGSEIIDGGDAFSEPDT